MRNAAAVLRLAILAASAGGCGDSGSEIVEPPSAVPELAFSIERIDEERAPDGEPRYLIRTAADEYTGRDFGGRMETHVRGNRIVVVTGLDGNIVAKNWSADVFDVRDERLVVVAQVEDVPESEGANPRSLLVDGRDLVDRWGVKRE